MTEHAFLYEDTDIPAEMTIAQWRVACAAAVPKRRRLRDRLLGR